MTGTAAPAAYGAPVAAAGEGPLELYVTDPVELSIVTRRDGAGCRAGRHRHPAAVVGHRAQRGRGDPDDRPAAGGAAIGGGPRWAQDTGRGHEILEQWRRYGIWL
jgi:hypothetical protein